MKDEGVVRRNALYNTCAVKGHGHASLHEEKYNTLRAGSLLSMYKRIRCMHRNVTILFFSPLLYLLIQTVEVGAGSGEEEGFDYNIIPVYVYSVITNCYCLTKKLYVASREHWSDYVARCLLSLGPCFFLFFFVGQ